MTIYKIINDPARGTPMQISRDDGWQIPFDPANTDYQQFKQAINDGKAELQDADGNVMSAQDAKQFVSTLP